MEINNSISRRESCAIKGLLIILVIIGHSQPLTDYPSRLWHYLYTFHVHGFFILPFLYPKKELSKNRIKNYFARLIVPYIILFTLFLIPQLITKSSSVDYIQCLEAFVTGGIYPLKNSINIIYIWFMPTMFSLYILRDYFNNNKSLFLQYVLLSVGFILYFFLWVCVYGPFFSDIRTKLMYISPISILQSIGALFLGVTTIFLLNRSNNKLITIFILLFVISTVFFFITPLGSPFILLLKLIMPIVVFVILYHCREHLANLSILTKMGEISFVIYIVQTPLCVLFYTIIPKYINTTNIIIAIFITLVLIASSYYFAKMIIKIKWLNRFLFPHSWNELIGKEI